MQADVGLCVQPAVPVANEHQGLAGEFEGHVVTGSRQCRRAAHAIPLPGEHVLYLGRQKLLRRIDALRHGPGLAEGDCNIGRKF